MNCLTCKSHYRATWPSQLVGQPCCLTVNGINGRELGEKVHAAWRALNNPDATYLDLVDCPGYVAGPPDYTETR